MKSSRRSFLRATGYGIGSGLIAGTTVANGAFVQSAIAGNASESFGGVRNDVDRRKGVELAIATICVDGFGDENFAPAFALIPQLGYQNVEFNTWYARNLTPAGIHGIQERCFEHGLKPISLQGPSFGGPTVKDVSHKLWMMEQARFLGCRRVKFTGSGRGTEGGLERVIEVLHELAPAAEEMDVLIAVENHANNVLENLDDYERIFEAIDSRHVGMCLDMGHFDAANVDNFEVVQRFHERVIHIDLKDVRERGKHEVVNFGSGVTDVEGIVEAMLQHGYSGYLVVEQARAQPEKDTLAEHLGEAYQRFRRFER